MITLGIECSSRQGSVALLRAGEVIAEKIWIADRIRHNVIFDELENLLNTAGVTYTDISQFAVGRGPGSFSGMRMSFAVAQALALPDKKEVRAVSSGAALAFQVAKENGAQKIAVAGDARRGQIWFGEFNAGQVAAEWKLIPYEEVEISSDVLVVSPEAERLEKIFPSIGAPRFPLAADVALLAQTSTEPLEPLYMHPPVFVEPKFLKTE